MQQSLGVPDRSFATTLFLAAIFSLILEVALLSFAVDAQAILEVGEPNLWQLAFANAGQFAKIGILSLVIAAILLNDRLAYYWRHLHNRFATRRFAVFMTANLVSFTLLFFLSQAVFSGLSVTSDLTSLTYISWLLLALATAFFSMLSIASGGLLREFWTAEFYRIGFATAIACCVWWLSVESQNLWGPLSQWTFSVAALLLSLLSSDLVVLLPDEKILGLGEFVVNVAPACSGYEGIALISAFSALYLFVRRAELRFPHAFSVFLIGATVIWILNSLRIAALVAIGHYWSPDVAIGGFHSQAGWLTFIATSLLMLWLVDKSKFLRKSRREVATLPLNVAAGTLLPFICLIAATLMTSAFSAGFDWLYPLRVIATVVALYFVWPLLRVKFSGLRWEGPAAGVLVAAVWINLLGTDEAYNSEFSASLASVSSLWASIWLLFRFIGATLTVPIAEELAFRGYLLCKFSRSESFVSGQLPVSVFAIVSSSLAFGALHGAWIAGTMAGLVYALVRLRGKSIVGAVVAHAVTNAIVVCYAFVSGNWVVI